MKIVGDRAIFGSGLEISAYGGVIGINPDLETHGGYDGAFYCGNDGREINHDEQRELADHMINLWERYRDAIPE